MTAKTKITLSASRDIPFDKLRLSQANVRHIKAGVSIEELAEDIARRTLLASLTVRPLLDDNGAETGLYEIPAGGRRFRALELLVKQKRLNKTAPVPCIVRLDGIAEEDSLAENIQRAPLHPLDQFRAFQAMRERGTGEEEIAAAFFVSTGVVKQRLKLAAVAPALLDLYADDAMTLEQLMAFTVNPDHERQEQVWAAIAQGYSKEPYTIRRMLTEATVRASDKRARFVGLEAYEEAGGAILRDLFQSDDGGWLQDTGLLDRMVAEGLNDAAAEIAAEGWKWVETAPDFAYGHSFGLRRLIGDPVEPTDAETAAYEALKAEYDRLEDEYDGAEELPDAIDARLGEIEDAMEAYRTRPLTFDAEEMARAGAFVSIDHDGTLRIERGYVRPEDEVPIEQPETGGDDAGALEADGDAAMSNGTTLTEPDDAPEEDGIKPLPDRLVAELTAHRTLALRNALAGDPDLAFRAALHAMCLKLFYRYAPDTCLEIDAKSVGFGVQAPGLAESASAQAIDARHESWAAQLPKASGDLWDALADFDAESRSALFAHCVGLTVNAVDEAYHRRPGALAHADRIAQATGLDMAAAGWRPTVDTYLGRVTKARILQAVVEAKGSAQAQLIDHLKKPEMAAEAETLLADSGWVPEPLRTPIAPAEAAEAPATGPDVRSDDTDRSTVAETAADDGERAIDPAAEDGDDGGEPKDALQAAE
ncbi:ParB/RepB/Spo0J family partition protein [Palleronia abyssalis]|uniref:Chromosome-partitioning protein Spo0J n=1 Tax=Palleronia abyssalis TaxID=1501240 RepID=A0A2R8BQQ7_9RHOB|nr:ParB/RepB/Spo0J family partition protein [Palleronia abyssalis]SPJ22480.1 Chromosome-partitioning protein Spo0J [Palleronia abyssalis]